MLMALCAGTGTAAVCIKRWTPLMLAVEVTCQPPRRAVGDWRAGTPWCANLSGMTRLHMADFQASVSIAAVLFNATMADDDTTAVGAPLTFAAWWVHPPVVDAFAVADTSLMGRSFARHGIVNSPSLWAPAASHYSGPIVRRLLAVGARVNVTGLNGSALWGRTWPAASPTRYRADGRGRLYGHDGRPITSGGVEAARQAVSAGDGDMVCLLEGACGERADTRPTCCQWVFLW